MLCALGNRFVFFLTFRFFTFRFCKLFVVERIKETFCVCVCVCVWGEVAGISVQSLFKRFFGDDWANILCIREIGSCS